MLTLQLPFDYESIKALVFSRKTILVTIKLETNLFGSQKNRNPSKPSLELNHFGLDGPKSDDGDGGIINFVFFCPISMHRNHVIMWIQ